MSKKTIGIVIAFIVLAFTIALGLFWPSVTTDKAEDSEAPKEESLGEQIYKSAENPVPEKLPNTNPFDVKVNPFENTQTNPVRSRYQNPF